MPVHLDDKPLYQPQGREDFAHFQGQGAKRVNDDLAKGIQPSPATQAVLDRARWDGQPLGPKAVEAMSTHMDENGHSFDYNLTVSFPEYDADPNNNPGEEPTPTPDPGTPASPDAVKQAEQFGRENVRADILEHIRIAERRGKKDAATILGDVKAYCESGRWPGQQGGGGEGSGGFHVPGSSS